MIESVNYGGHLIKPWYNSPGYLDCQSRGSRSFRTKEPPSLWKNVGEGADPKLDLHICPRCFLYGSDPEDIKKHIEFCRYKEGETAGKLVYKSKQYSLHEVRAETDSSKLFLQCLSLFGRLFLDTKSICFAMEGFVFYTLIDLESGLLAGFFSKEKESWHDYNLACIVVFPPFQKRGYARALISYSYYLSRQQGAFGSPEKPLSALGFKTYMSYWCSEVLRALLDSNWSTTRPCTLRELGLITGIDPRDVYAALEHLEVINRASNGRCTIDYDKVKLALEKHTIPAAFEEAYAITS